MLRMTVSELNGYQASHQVYNNDEFIGSISVWNDHIAGQYRNICACYVRDFSVSYHATIASAVRWLVTKEVNQHV